MFYRIIVATTSAVALAACTASAPPEPSVSVAADVEEAADSVVRSQSVTMTAVVENIDHETREVTLRGPEEMLETVVVDPSVRNLSQVRKGDTVNVEYFESIAFEVIDPKAALPGGAAVAEGIERSRPGEKPGGVSARAITVVTTVESIDKERGSFTLKGPAGNTRTLKAQNPKNLDKIKPGDTVQVTYTQAVAIAVEKP